MDGWTDGRTDGQITQKRRAVVSILNIHSMPFLAVRNGNVAFSESGWTSSPRTTSTAPTVKRFACGPR